MQAWRLIDTGDHHGYYNMAVDEAIAMACREGIIPPTLRFYTWNPPCISIGYFQKLHKLFNKDQLDNESMLIVRRITGGKAVFHGHDLSYSIVCSTENSLFPGNIKGTYDAVAKALTTGLRYLGISTDPLNRTCSPLNTKRYRTSTLCFATTLGHEISIKGRKLIGSAQRRWSGTFLQHGAMLVTGSSSGNGHDSITLGEITGERPDIKAIISALCRGFSDTFGINLLEGELTGYEIDLARRLMSEKYSQDFWNIRTSSS